MTNQTSPETIRKLVDKVLSKTYTRSEQFRLAVLEVFYSKSNIPAPFKNTFPLGTPEADAFEYGKQFAETKWKELARKQQQQQTCKECQE